MSDFKVTGINSSEIGETFVAEVKSGQGQVDEHRTVNVEHLLLMLSSDSCVSPANTNCEYLKTLEFKTTGG